MTRVVEADETGRQVLSSEILGEIKPHERYTIETFGTKLILEAEAAMLERQRTYKEWEQEWDALTE